MSTPASASIVAPHIMPQLSGIQLQNIDAIVASRIAAKRWENFKRDEFRSFVAGALLLAPVDAATGKQQLSLDEITEWLCAFYQDFDDKTIVEKMLDELVEENFIKKQQFGIMLPGHTRLSPGKRVFWINYQPGGICQDYVESVYHAGVLESTTVARLGLTEKERSLVPLLRMEISWNVHSTPYPFAYLGSPLSHSIEDAFHSIYSVSSNKY